MEFPVRVVTPGHGPRCESARRGDGARGLLAQRVVVIRRGDVPRVGGGLGPAVIEVSVISDISDGLATGRGRAYAGQTSGGVVAVVGFGWSVIDGVVLVE